MQLCDMQLYDTYAHLDWIACMHVQTRVSTWIFLDGYKFDPT